jgi:uncharacterized protein (DUF1501 family)
MADGCHANREQVRTHLSRRDVLAGSATLGIAAAVSHAAAGPVGPIADRSCILLLLTGGPSQLETWDPKPDAPEEVRGPFGAIATSIPGIRISEHLPHIAAIAHRWALVRSVHHTAPPIHETGMQLLQTGRICRHDGEYPHFGAVLAQHFGPRRPGVPPFVILPSLLGNTGVQVAQGQSAGFLGSLHSPVVDATRHAQSASDAQRYGRTVFGAHCLRARQLIESGVRSVVVNMFDTLYDRVTWDCHADRRCLASTLDDYRRTLCPTLDRACAALIDDLHQRGMLASTLVVAAGEFGRTPYLNHNGGREHWPGVWSVLVAGGGVRGGQVIGASDKLASEPARRPVRAEDIAATVCHAFGLDPAPLTPGRPIGELFS